ncbi:MAG: M42 family peptidase [Clostridia bacterium]|nr:M42 family peptidase [Clostridia bacterium]
MTDLSVFLGEITALRGISGDESPVSSAVAEAFQHFCDEVTIDAMQSVTARIGKAGPRVMITAHLDEIGMIATIVEDDGAVRFGRVGGVDPRILPGSRVTVHTDDGPLSGVIGALPPHLLSAEDKKTNYKMEALFVDLGLPAARVKEIVHAGTQITLNGPLTALENGRCAAKTIDDRGGVAVMLRLAELLQNRIVPCQLFLVSAVQEEVGGLGAATSAYSLRPDIAVAIDVTHAEMPGCEPDDVFPLDKVVLTEGPNIHPKLHAHLLALAQKHRVDAQTAVCAHVTWTDAASLQIARAGVPTALIEIPLKYMHTTVETVSIGVIEESARLLAAFVTELSDGWEGLTCY